MINGVNDTEVGKLLNEYGQKLYDRANGLWEQNKAPLVEEKKKEKVGESDDMLHREVARSKQKYDALVQQKDEKYNQEKELLAKASAAKKWGEKAQYVKALLVSGLRNIWNKEIPSDGEIEDAKQQLKTSIGAYLEGRKPENRAKGVEEINDYELKKSQENALRSEDERMNREAAANQEAQIKAIDEHNKAVAKNKAQLQILDGLNSSNPDDKAKSAVNNAIREVGKSAKYKNTAIEKDHSESMMEGLRSGKYKTIEEAVAKDLIEPLEQKQERKALREATISASRKKAADAQKAELEVQLKAARLMKGKK